MICKCGCRGSHTVQALWNVLAWQLRIASEGVWPRRDFAGAEWPAESARAVRAGKPLFLDGGGKMCFAAVCEISLDLDEMPKSMGLPDYRSSYGCLNCFKRKSNFDDFTTPAKRRCHRWLVESAQTCLSKYPVVDDDLDVIENNTESKKRKAGVTFMRGVPCFPGVRKGDRLEPSLPGCPDVWHRQSVEDFPSRMRSVLIYRRPKNGLLFVCRLFCIPGVQPGVPGVTIDHVLLDQMHLLELGVVCYYAGAVVSSLVNQGMFGREDDDIEEGLTDAMKAWYKASGLPDNERLTVFTLGMLKGTDTQLPFLKLKAAKMKSLLPFLVHLLARSGGEQLLNEACAYGSEGTLLRQVGEAIVEYYDVLKSEARDMEELALQHAQDALTRAATAWTSSGRKIMPKFHAAVEHLVPQMRFAGNATFSHNYRDEGYNFGSRKRGTFVYRPKFVEGFLVKWFLQHLQDQGQ